MERRLRDRTGVGRERPGGPAATEHQSGQYQKGVRTSGLGPGYDPQARTLASRVIGGPPRRPMGGCCPTGRVRHTTLFLHRKQNSETVRPSPWTSTTPPSG